MEFLLVAPFALALAVLAYRRKARTAAMPSAPPRLTFPDAKRLAPVLAYRADFRRPGFRAWDPDRQPHPEAPEIRQFVRALDQAGLLRDFDWPAWMREQGDRYTGAESLATADFETLARLLSALVRKDRFAEGQLAALVDSGWMAAALERLDALANQPMPSAPPQGDM